MPMKKQELIHLHGLLVEVAEYCATMNDSHLNLERYHTLGTRPMSIHQSKTQHKDAVFALTEGITAMIRDEPVEIEVPSAAD